MTVYARHQFPVQDKHGNVLPGAEVTVQKEAAGFPLATLFLDINGSVPAGNPISADDEGFVYFHADGGQYKITIRSGSYSRILRYVQVGVATGASPGLTQRFTSPTADADPGAGAFRLNNAALASVTAIYMDNLDAGGVDVSAYLDTFDDAGVLANRGTLEIRSASSLNAYGVFRVNNAVVDGTGYRKLAVDFIAGGGTFDGDFVFSFSRAGAGDASGPSGATSGNIPVFADGTGKALSDSSKAFSTDGTLASNSDAKIPTEKAVKAYVDTAPDRINLYQGKGPLDCSTNPNYPAAESGHVYIVSVAGKIGGGSGVDVEVGDLLICKTDSSSAGNHSTVGANWTIGQNNIVAPLKGADIGVTVQGYDANIAKINATQQWSKPQRTSAGTLTSATAWDASDKQRWTADVNGGAFSISNPTGGTPIDGQTYVITVNYTTSHSISWGSKFKGMGSVTPTATAGAADEFAFRYHSGTDEFRSIGYRLNGRA